MAIIIVHVQEDCTTFVVFDQGCGPDTSINTGVVMDHNGKLNQQFIVMYIPHVQSLVNYCSSSTTGN